MKIQTNRLVIRKTTEEDAQFILKLLNDPLYIEMIRDSGVRDLEEARKYIRNTYLKSYADHGFGLYIIESSTLLPLGIAGFIKRDGLDYPDLGFALLNEHSGKGFSQEAVNALIKYASTSLKLKKLGAITTDNNLGSINVLEKTGFIFKNKITIPHSQKLFQYYEQELL